MRALVTPRGPGKLNPDLYHGNCVVSCIGRLYYSRIMGVKFLFAPAVDCVKLVLVSAGDLSRG